MEITEESKALLEEYNKTVSFLLSQAPEECCPKPCPFVPSPSLSLSSHPNQPVSLLPYPLANAKSLRSLTQAPVLTLTCHQTILLSKQFVQWDELLCQLEAAKQVKPAEE